MTIYRQFNLLVACALSVAVIPACASGQYTEQDILKKSCIPASSRTEFTGYEVYDYEPLATHCHLITSRVIYEITRHNLDYKDNHLVPREWIWSNELKHNVANGHYGNFVPTRYESVRGTRTVAIKRVSGKAPAVY